MKALDLAQIALFSVVIVICSWICIPTMIPFTLQTFGVFLAVAVLGGKRGSLAVLTYLLLGAVGLPVFSGFTGGIGVLLGNTGGYLVGFLFAALTVWLLECFPCPKKWLLPLAMVLGLLVCYATGTLWFLAVYGRNTGDIGLLTVLSWCVFPYIIPDLMKIGLALTLRKRLAVIIK